VLTCAERVAQPIKLKPGGTEAAKSKPVESVRAAALADDPKLFGFTGSPTWVQEVLVQETPKTECTFIEPSDPERAAAALVAALDKSGALARRARERRAIAPAVRKSARGRDLWVACESDLEGRVTRATLELLSCGDALATRLGGAQVALGFNAPFARHAGLLASYGADQLLILEHPDLDPYTPEGVAEAVARLVRERAPWGILLPASERGRDWGPRLAARLGLGLTGDAIGIELDAENRMVALKPAFGGNIVAPIFSKTFPQMATVRQGVLEMAEPAARREATVEILRAEMKPPLSRLLQAHSLLDDSLLPLEGAEVVVGVGTGAGGPEGVARIEQFARAIGAGVCATRRVTDAGWIPRQLQVGLTGKAIDPRLYFAIGVRGAPNHTVGLKRAQMIVAINNDPDALIFERANIGIVADWAAVLPAIQDALQRRLE
jgi:electron transfer flavoprotein alpha subunit